MSENDGWGHALESVTVADDLKELKGYLDGTDKHEQVMEKLNEQTQSENGAKRLP